ncbi:glycosyltransferase family 2 protein, partial [bacterium]|nr:glycosyltransferase family 2 protein [candidate division CSSED10-310 bacterium]
MVEFLETHPDTGAVAPKLLNSDGSLQYSIRKFPTVLTPFTENLNLFHVPFIKRYTSISHLMNWDHESICEVDQPAGAAFMLKRSVIETLGVLDNAYHMFFEDVDLCYRIKRNGWKIYYLPDAQIIHYGGQSVKQSVNIGDEFYKSMLKYFRRHHGSWREKKVRIVMILGSVVYLFFAAFTFFKSPRQAYNLAKSAIKVFRYAFRFKHSGYALSTEDMQLC